MASMRQRRQLTPLNFPDWKKLQVRTLSSIPQVQAQALSSTAQAHLLCSRHSYLHTRNFATINRMCMQLVLSTFGYKHPPAGFGQIMLCVYCVLNTNYTHKIPHHEYNHTKTTEIVSCTTPSVPLTIIHLWRILPGMQYNALIEWMALQTCHNTELSLMQ